MLSVELCFLTLPAQAPLRDERAVPGDVLGGQVLQPPPPAADQQQQATPAVVIVLVHLEVLGQVIDPPSQQCDLDLRRTGVTLTGAVPGDDLLLHGCVQRHVSFLSLRLVIQWARCGKPQSGSPLGQPSEGTASPAAQRRPQFTVPRRGTSPGGQRLGSRTSGPAW